ncbi:MAG: hypothetical protein ACUVWK_04820 [Nitrososphaerales archaeon]
MTAHPRMREGDFLKIYDGTIFEVKGLSHPSGKVIAFIRYIPNLKGDRQLDGKSYRKVYSIDERYRILKERYPQFLIFDDAFGEYVPEVDFSSILHVYKPQDRLHEIRKNAQLGKLERQALLFIETLKREAKISWSNLGITGSILVGLYIDKSDIDIIIYGIKNCLQVRSAMQGLLASEQHVSRYRMKDLRRLYQFRVKDTVMPFKEFVKHEIRKSFQGIFDGREFFIRYIRDWDEVKEKYDEVKYKPEGYAKIRAKITDDSESIFTPCVYRVEDVEVIEGQEWRELREISSFRGRFCEQARNDETVIAQGKIERVITADEDYHRILLGSRPKDYMITLT